MMDFNISQNIVTLVNMNHRVLEKLKYFSPVSFYFYKWLSWVRIRSREVETEDDVSSTLESLESYVKQRSGHKGSQVETESVELNRV